MELLSEILRDKTMKNYLYASPMMFHTNSRFADYNQWLKRLDGHSRMNLHFQKNIIFSYPGKNMKDKSETDTIDFQFTEKHHVVL